MFMERHEAGYRQMVMPDEAGKQVMRKRVMSEL
jgi:hypothetical protein